MGKLTKNLPMDLLRAFVTVAELGGVTRTGERLGRSQPAISLQIKRLESLLDTVLFIRQGQQLTLTPSGRVLFDYARHILQLNDEAVRHFTETAVSGKIRLGIPSEFATTLLPKIIGRFAAAYPNVTLEITSDLSKNLLPEHRQGNFDLILILHDDPAGHHEGKVKEDELVWVSPPEHNAHTLARRQEAIPLIVAPEGCIYRNRMIQTLAKSGLAWRIIYTIPDLTGIRAAIQEGLGVTALARSIVPPSLQILKSSERFPKLGNVSIRLLPGYNQKDEATARLIDYLKSSLN